MRRRPPSPRALTRSLPWYALAALITVTLYWNFDAHVEAHGEPGVGSHRPKLIAFESKILQGKRPEALYDVVEFCAQRGYKVVGPVMANHVCVRGD